MDDRLKLKIQNTKLFSSEQKIAILVRLDELSPDEKKQTENVIDDFDQSYRAKLRQFKSDVFDELENIKRTTDKSQWNQVNQSIIKIKQNLDIIIPDKE